MQVPLMNFFVINVKPDSCLGKVKRFGYHLWPRPCKIGLSIEWSALNCSVKQVEMSKMKLSRIKVFISSLLPLLPYLNDDFTLRS